MEVECVALEKKRPRWIHGFSLVSVVGFFFDCSPFNRSYYPCLGQEPSSAYYILTIYTPSKLPTRQSYARCRNVAGTKRVDNRTQCDATVRMACVPEFRTATLVSRRVTFTSDTADHPDPTADAAPILCCDALTFTAQ